MNTPAISRNTRRARFAQWLFMELTWRVSATRLPDFIVGGDDPKGAYLHRWYITPWRGWYRHVEEEVRNRWQRFAVRVSRLLPNLYLHKFQRDDDDRAHHDHPSFAFSLILARGYFEHTISAGGIHHRKFYGPGSLRFMRTHHVHRIELLRDAEGNPLPCWSLFLFGPTLREWGFHCPERGWVHWKVFTAKGKPGEVGKGCDA